MPTDVNELISIFKELKFILKKYEDLLNLNLILIANIIYGLSKMLK